MNVYYKVLSVSIVSNRKLQWFILFNLQNGYIQTDDFEISIDHMGHSETEKVTEVIQHHVKTCTIPAGILNNILYNQNQIQVTVECHKYHQIHVLQIGSGGGGLWFCYVRNKRYFLP